MLLLKSCPKCRGDIVEERDRYGSYTHCIQCGYTRDVQPRNPVSFLARDSKLGQRPANTDSSSRGLV